VGIDEDEVVPDHRNAEDEGVDAVENATVAGEEAAGIFYAGGTFAGGFEKVAHLTGDIAEGGHDKEMRERDGEPEVEAVGDGERAEHGGDGAFPGFLGRDFRRERMFADGAADEVGDGVGGPNNDEGEEEEPGTFSGNSMKTHGEGERKSNEQKRGRGDTGGRQRLNKWAASEKRADGEAEEKDKEERKGGVRSPNGSKVSWPR